MTITIPFIDGLELAQQVTQANDELHRKLLDARGKKPGWPKTKLLSVTADGATYEVSL